MTERADFDAWFRNLKMADIDESIEWTAWQARASRATPAPANSTAKERAADILLALRQALTIAFQARGHEGRWAVIEEFIWRVEHNESLMGAALSALPREPEPPRLKLSDYSCARCGCANIVPNDPPSESASVVHPIAKEQA